MQQVVQQQQHQQDEEEAMNLDFDATLVNGENKETTTEVVQEQEEDMQTKKAIIALEGAVAQLHHAEQVAAVTATPGTPLSTQRYPGTPLRQPPEDVPSSPLLLDGFTPVRTTRTSNASTPF